MKALDGPRRAPSRDFTDLHAWCEVYLPGAGWIGLDPTVGTARRRRTHPAGVHAGAVQRGAGHRRRRDVRGRVRARDVGAAHRRIAARHQAVHRRRSGTAILACGRAVDADLAAGDVRLTMGGEPTFVSATDRDADEWNTAALGPTKRAARRAICWRRMKQRYGARRLRALRPGQVVSGRAAAALGARLLLARRRRAGLERSRRCSPTSSSPDGHGAADAERFVTHARRDSWASPPRTCTPGYEDVWYYLWRERRLPVNVDPFDARLDDELERDRLRRVFTQGLDAVVGYALPLRRAGGRDGRWRHRTVVPAQRAAVSGAGRLADGLPAAARLAAVGGAGRSRRDRRARSVRAAPAAPPGREARVIPDRPTRPCRLTARRVRHRPRNRARWTPLPSRSTTAAESAGRAASRPPGSCVRRCASSRAAACLYVFMPPVETARGLPRAGRRRRSDRATRSACACCSKAIRRRAIRGCRISSSRRIPA